MGNSEVGHLTIGSGRVLDQDFQRVNRAIADGTLLENAALVGAFERAKQRGTNVHLLGLVSYGGVHSHIDHLRALLELGRRQGMEGRSFIHAFIKGLVDVPVLYGGSVKPENAAELLAQPSIDGALVGGASLEPTSFAAICQAASTS